MNSLKESVMIVNLTISQWGARKYDKTATKEVEDNHQAREAGRFNKVLMQSETLTNIGKIGNKIRTYHYENTLPWGDNGDRILPTEKYWQYVTEVGTMKMDFNTTADQFIDEYIEEKERSKIRLNSLYKEGDYPQSESIRKKFDVGVSFMPIADGNDLRVNMSAEVIDTIKSQITRELEKRVEGATDEMLQRLRDAVGHMAETLKDHNKVFRDSLVGNIQSLTESLPLLNFNNDQRVVDAVNYCKTLCVDPDELRFKRKFRLEIAAKAQQILESI